jgi:hypothetical protein
MCFAWNRARDDGTSGDSPFVASDNGTTGVQAEAVQAVVGRLAEEQERVAGGGLHRNALLAARRVHRTAHVLHNHGFNFR